MASEYYKWLARDVKPEAEKELTRREKWQNWWYYHKWYVVAAVVCLVFLADLCYDVVHNARNRPDYQIAYVGSTALPEDTALALELAFAGLGEDVNGNGEVRAELTSYILSEEGGSQQSYNASMMLLMNIETTESVIFLLEDPETFAAGYPILTADPGAPLYYRLSDCPALAELELPLGDISIARREIPDGDRTAITDGALALWEVLTADAAG